MNQQQADKLAELEARHKELDENIAWGYSFYQDDVDMSKMKKEKLIVKEQIESILKQPA
jgi:hypothetical protein